MTGIRQNTLALFYHTFLYSESRIGYHNIILFNNLEIIPIGGAKSEKETCSQSS